MSLFEWDENYSVQNIEFDSQHKELIKLINELHNAMQEKKGKQVLEKILEGLIDYTNIHFSTEEMVMMLYGYPDYDKHTQVHNQFVKQVMEFYKDFQAGKVFVDLRIINFLKNWILKHILDMDKEYVSFFVDRGLK